MHDKRFYQQILDRHQPQRAQRQRVARFILGLFCAQAFNVPLCAGLCVPSSGGALFNINETTSPFASRIATPARHALTFLNNQWLAGKRMISSAQAIWNRNNPETDLFWYGVHGAFVGLCALSLQQAWHTDHCDFSSTTANLQTALVPVTQASPTEERFSLPLNRLLLTLPVISLLQATDTIVSAFLQSCLPWKVVIATQPLVHRPEIFDNKLLEVMDFEKIGEHSIALSGQNLTQKRAYITSEIQRLYNTILNIYPHSALKSAYRMLVELSRQHNQYYVQHAINSGTADAIDRAIRMQKIENPRFIQHNGSLIGWSPQGHPQVRQQKGPHDGHALILDTLIPEGANVTTVVTTQKGQGYSLTLNFRHDIVRTQPLAYSFSVKVNHHQVSIKKSLAKKGRKKRQYIPTIRDLELGRRFWRAMRKRYNESQTTTTTTTQSTTLNDDLVAERRVDQQDSHNVIEPWHTALLTFVATTDQTELLLGSKTLQHGPLPLMSVMIANVNLFSNAISNTQRSSNAALTAKILGSTGTTLSFVGAAAYWRVKKRMAPAIPEIMHHTAALHTQDVQNGLAAAYHILEDVESDPTVALNNLLQAPGKAYTKRYFKRGLETNTLSKLEEAGFTMQNWPVLEEAGLLHGDYLDKVVTPQANIHRRTIIKFHSQKSTEQFLHAFHDHLKKPRNLPLKREILEFKGLLGLPYTKREMAKHNSVVIYHSDATIEGEDIHETIANYIKTFFQGETSHTLPFYYNPTTEPGVGWAVHDAASSSSYAPLVRNTLLNIYNDIKEASEVVTEEDFVTQGAEALAELGVLL
ncbi:MAG: hypothetical protein ACPG7U_04605 [Holosporaceae bacterium]